MAIIIFSGIRQFQGKKIFSYYNPETDSYATFSKLLVKEVGIVGAVFETQISEDGNSFSKTKMIRRSEESDSWFTLIKGWYIEQRVAKDELQHLLDVKKFNEDPIEKLIEDVRNSVSWRTSRIERNRIARYVFEQLMK